MKSFTKYLLATTFLVFLIPHVSFAASPAQAQQLSQELSQLQTTLATGISSTTFSLSPGQSIRQATSSDSKGILTITLPDFLHTNPDPTIPSVVSQQPVSYLAEIKLEYDPCIAAAPSVCISEASSSYPVMTSRLMQGQDTGYLNYLITLTSLSSTTATFSITDSSFLPSIQTQINEIAAQVHALLGS